MLLHRDIAARGRRTRSDPRRIDRRLRTGAPHQAARSDPYRTHDRVESTRAYRSFDELRRMVSRTAFTELRHSVPRLASGRRGAARRGLHRATVASRCRPSLRLRATGSVSRWACMALAFQPMLRFYRLSPWWGLALPAIAATYPLLHARLGVAASARPRRRMEGSHRARVAASRGRRAGIAAAPAAMASPPHASMMRNPRAASRRPNAREHPRRSARRGDRRGRNGAAAARSVPTATGSSSSRPTSRFPPSTSRFSTTSGNTTRRSRGTDRDATCGAGRARTAAGRWSTTDRST